MPLLKAKATSASAGAKFGAVAGMALLPLVPGALGHTVSGFMAFSAVMLLKCLRSKSAAVPSSESAPMAAPTGKSTTRKRTEIWVFNGGALAGGGKPPEPLPPPLALCGGVSLPPPQAASSNESATPIAAQYRLMENFLVRPWDDLADARAPRQGVASGTSNRGSSLTPCRFPTDISSSLYISRRPRAIRCGSCAHHCSTDTAPSSLCAIPSTAPCLTTTSCASGRNTMRAAM